MIRKLIPVLLALLGLGVGIGAGLFLRAPPEPMATGDHAAHATDGDHGVKAETEVPIDPEMMPDYVKMNNQFIVPILDDGRIVAMVVLSLSLEVKQGSTDDVFAREPKLRDVFLQVMFDHANAGGFLGSFTDAANLVQLRSALLEAAKSTLGEIVSDVLIVDIVRQDS